MRLFRRGHHEENWIVSDLKAIGIDVQEIDLSTGEQYRFSDGHFSGSLDGIALSGVPEAPEKKHILEFKTHALKSFTDLQKNGVEKSKPTHYAQMQVYMLSQDIDRALYVAVCKNDDEIYTERVRLNKTIAKELNIKAQDIIASLNVSGAQHLSYVTKKSPQSMLTAEPAPTLPQNVTELGHVRVGIQQYRA